MGRGTSIQASWDQLKVSVQNICVKCGRSPDEIQIVAVTKTVPEFGILEAWNAGAGIFGENRVQELLAKKDRLPPGAKWHLIGHLQTNKVRQVLGCVDLIHSLDRPELAVEIDSQAKKHTICEVPCLIQVNVSGETGKFGFAPAHVSDFVASLVRGSAVRIRGLMTIGPNTKNDSEIRSVFRKTRELRDQLALDFPAHRWDELSMGMSGDYPIAIEEGATMIRVGTAIFGER